MQRRVSEEKEEECEVRKKRKNIRTERKSVRKKKVFKLNKIN